MWNWISICDRGKSRPLCGQPSYPRHQFEAEMSKAKVSWLLCIGRLVSKTENVMHFAHLVKQVCVDLVSDLFVYYRLGCEPFVCSWGLHGLALSVFEATVWNHLICWVPQTLPCWSNSDCSVRGSSPIGCHVTVASHAPCVVNQAILDTSLRQKCLRLRCHDFSALAD